MRPFNVISILLLVTGLSSVVFGQQENSDTTNPSPPNSWNYLIINFWENPALAGIDNRHNFVMDIDNDHVGNSFNVGYEGLLPLNKAWAFGLGAYYGRKLFDFSDNRKMTVGIAGAVQYRFKKESYLSAGVSLGMINMHNDRFSNASFFTAYYGGSTYHPIVPENWDSADAFKTEIIRFGPMNVGVWYNGKNFFAGVSADNITRYDESVFPGKKSSPVYFQLATGYHFNINDKVTFTPSVVYRTQQFLVHRIEPRLTVGLVKNRLIIGSYYQNKRLYGMFGGDITGYIQLTGSIGGAVSKEEDHPDVFFRTTIRVHFMSRKNKSFPGTK